MKNLFITILLLVPSIMFAQTDTTSIILQEGTMIRAALTQDISGKEVSIGQAVDFVLSEDVTLNDKIIVPKGARIIGAVTEAERSKALGKKGKLAFSIDYLYLGNGKIVKLRGQTEKNLNGSGAAVVAGAILLSPVALLFHGKNAKYEKGEVFTAYVDKEVKL